MKKDLILSDDSKNNAEQVLKSLIGIEEPLLVEFRSVDFNDQDVWGTAEISVGYTIYREVKIVYISNGQHWVGEFVMLEYRKANPKTFRVPMLHFFLYLNDKSAKKYDSSKSYHIFLTELIY